jgi:molybdate transport system regulatory protein
MTTDRLRVRSALTLETHAGALAGKRWMELLARLGTSRSITAAAKAVGLSYKAAWDAIEAMNNLSERPLVERTKGGRGGGGTKLTERGRQLVATFSAIEAENNRFLEVLNSRISHLDQDLRIIGRLTMLTSARNHFAGKVTRIRKGSVNDEVELALSGGEHLTAILTHESVQNLGLKPGVEAVALVKASWVIVALPTRAPLKLSARNQLGGTIKRLTPGAVNSEVVIELKGGNSVAAIITNEAARELKLAIGKRVIAIFKASSVILGVTG